jgi:zinc protease
VVTDDELERAKARLELSTLQGLETASGKAEQIGFYETVLGDPSGVHRRLEAIRRVTPSDVRTAARKALVPTSRTIVVVKPESGGAS